MPADLSRFVFKADRCWWPPFLQTFPHFRRLSLPFLQKLLAFPFCSPHSSGPAARAPSPKGSVYGHI